MTKKLTHPLRLPGPEHSLSDFWEVELPGLHTNPKVEQGQRRRYAGGGRLLEVNNNTKVEQANITIENAQRTQLLLSLCESEPSAPYHHLSLTNSIVISAFDLSDDNLPKPPRRSNTTSCIGAGSWIQISFGMAHCYDFVCQAM
jgi:hypothetical protein